MNESTQRNLSTAFLVTLMVWGVLTVLSYMGIPVHDQVLVNSDTNALLEQVCPTDASSGTFLSWMILCRGMVAAPIALLYFFQYLSPIAWYIVWSIILFGGFLFWRALVTGEWRLRGTVKLWQLFAFFLLCMWLIFSVLSRSLGSSDNPMRIMYEPLPQVYVNATPTELASLKQNQDQLLKRGCLTEIGATSHGAKVFQMREWCVQATFISRVLPPLGILLLLTFEFLVLGSALLSLGRVSTENKSLHALFSVGLGACGWMVILWLLALSGQYVGWAGWLLFALIPAICYKELLRWGRMLKNASFEVDLPWWSGTLLLFWILISLFALNYITVIRPFPIGWDDLGKYLNQPRLLVSYGHFIPTLATFQWEYITSLGFLLFGYDSVFGATTAMQINWLAGPFAVFTVYLFARRLMGNGAGLLSALLYYSLPIIGHFSFADMKPDNAIFAVGTLSLLSAFTYFFPAHHGDDDEAEEQGHHRNWKYLVLAGLLGGFAFGMKATGIMVPLTIGAMLFGVYLSGWGFAGACSFIVALLAAQGALGLNKMSQYIFGNTSSLPKSVVISIFAVLGIALIGVSAWKRCGAVRPLVIAVGIFVTSFLVAALPWMAVNSWKSGDIIPRLIFTPPNLIATRMEISSKNPVPRFGEPVRTLPTELQVDQNNAACKSTGTVEELDRYWGSDGGLSHYLGLPWRVVMNSDTGGYYVTSYPALLLFPLLLLIPYFWVKRARPLRWLWLATLLIVTQWVFLGNGVPWYGIAMFLGLTVLLEVMIHYSPTKATHRIAWIFISISLLIGLANRLWQLDQQRAIYEYPMGKVSAGVLRTRTIANYDLIRDTVVSQAKKYPNAPFIYRMGTFIPYFIPKNIELLPVADNQLDFFNCLNQEHDHALTLRRLQALGFSSLIFDTNTTTIEANPQGSLHMKAQELLNFLNDPISHATPVVNAPDDGVIFVTFPVN